LKINQAERNEQGGRIRRKGKRFNGPGRILDIGTKQMLAIPKRTRSVNVATLQRDSLRASNNAEIDDFSAWRQQVPTAENRTDAGAKNKERQQRKTKRSEKSVFAWACGRYGSGFAGRRSRTDLSLHIGDPPRK
jgi:hypothetical protein